MVEEYQHFPQGFRHHHQPQYLVAHPCKKQISKNAFVNSNKMVPERGSVPIVIQDHPCYPLLCIIRFLCISEVTEVPLQVSILSIFLVGLIKSHAKLFFFLQYFLIDFSQNKFQHLIKITPLLCPEYSTSPFLLWGFSNFP